MVSELVGPVSDERSESTFYRVLREEAFSIRAAARALHPIGRASTSPMVRGRWRRGTSPISAATFRGQFFFFYLVEDVWSRKILGWDVHEVESETLAARIVERIRLEADVKISPTAGENQAWCRDP